jgi:hypothetical protein
MDSIVVLASTPNSSIKNTRAEIVTICSPHKVQQNHALEPLQYNSCPCQPRVTTKRTVTTEIWMNTRASCAETALSCDRSPTTTAFSTSSRSMKPRLYEATICTRYWMARRYMQLQRAPCQTQRNVRGICDLRRPMQGASRGTVGMRVLE